MREGAQNRASISHTSCVPEVELRKQMVHNPVVNLKDMLCHYVDL